MALKFNQGRDGCLTMCFIIAGLQPRTKLLEPTPRRCPSCGLQQAYLQRVDHYLSLFFIPLLPVRRGDPFLFCRRCNQAVEGAAKNQAGHGPPPGGAAPDRCAQCGRTLQAAFKYCPHCGQRQY
jgi:predicted RNA-binding Zn-ribbon protein involved in translation (DUF1610 family)